MIQASLLIPLLFWQLLWVYKLLLSAVVQNPRAPFLRKRTISLKVDLMEFGAECTDDQRIGSDQRIVVSSSVSTSSKSSLFSVVSGSCFASLCN
ncbi:hypothetical protein Mapa_011568 [Marchantia paleacea]|nr:hypothetical protein Mapa_011568 [Marchantia paleacea]